MICMNRDFANEYCNELYSVEGWNSWIVGTVEHGENDAMIIPNPAIIEVESNR